MPSKKLPIECLTLDPEVQSRVEISQKAIDEYAEEYRAGTEMPAIVVFNDGKDTPFFVAAGFHRTPAATKAGLTEILCVIKKGGKREAILFSVQSNNTNISVRRTNADKRRSVEMLLKDEEWSKWSNREVAKRCGVDEGSVRKYRDGLSAELPQIETPSSSTRTAQRGGTTFTMDTSNIGKPKDDDDPILCTICARNKRIGKPIDAKCKFCNDLREKAERPDPSIAQDAYNSANGRNHERNGKPTDVPEDAGDAWEPPADESNPTDDDGNPIPEHARQAFQNAVGMRAWCRKVNTMISEAKEFIKGTGGRLMSLETVEHHLDQAKSNVSANIPTHVCPYCDGEKSKPPCECCKGQGWTAKHIYNQAPGKSKRTKK